jgi:hypothetical protein
MFYGRCAEGDKVGRFAQGGMWGRRTRNSHVVLLASSSPLGRAVAAPLSAAPPYISAGAAIPSSAKPLASVRRVATVKARRAVRVGSGEVSTGQA